MNEDFVAFETAKKLKEKGFDWETSNVYERNTLACRYEDYPKPTIAQVLKWLREEKGIFIEVEYVNRKIYGCTIIEQKDGGMIAAWDWDKFHYANKNPLTGNTYEETAIAGIEYTLDNLI